VFVAICERIKRTLIQRECGLRTTQQKRGQRESTADRRGSEPGGERAGRTPEPTASVPAVCRLNTSYHPNFPGVPGIPLGLQDPSHIFA
jgi:hypothetical protein